MTYKSQGHIDPYLPPYFKSIIVGETRKLPNCNKGNAVTYKSKGHIDPYFKSNIVSENDDGYIYVYNLKYRVLH